MCLHFIVVAISDKWENINVKYKIQNIKIANIYLLKAGPYLAFCCPRPKFFLSNLFGYMSLK